MAAQPDIDALRSKYAAIAATRDATVEAALAGNEIAASAAFEGQKTSEFSSPPELTVSDAVDSLRLCIACQGCGQISRLYNHMMMTRTCEACGGDGVVAAQPAPVPTK
jgi:DnaJ-class molecular chaperone